MKKFIVFFILFLCGCGIENIVETEQINAPSGLVAYPKDSKIKIKFYSNNKEEKFSGFNIYISKSSSLRSQPSLTPVKNPINGGLPTISASPSDIDPNIPIITELKFDAENNYIENGITYFLIVKSFSIRGIESLPSNEVSVTPRIENTNGVILYTNEGFNFKNFSKSAPYDFIFTIQNTPVKKAFITGKNESKIISKGFYLNWEEINQADTTGYINQNIPIEINEKYVILFKTSDNHYAKIWIVNLNLDSNNPYLKFIWAYQTVPNNTSI